MHSDFRKVTQVFEAMSRESFLIEHEEKQMNRIPIKLGCGFN